MNAILGITRPGDFGADMKHYNPHKTFSGPHGGGGPGAGPICVTREARAVSADAGRRRRTASDIASTTTGPSRSAACELLRQRRRAGAGLLLHPHARARRPAARQRERGAQRQLPAQPREALPARAAGRPLHARVRRHRPPSSRAEKGISAMDLAKRLLDYGFHAPTVYFPLTVPEAMMIEPTETESKETLDAFAETLFRITEEDADTAARRAAHHADQPAGRSAGRPAAGARLAGGSDACGRLPPHRRSARAAARGTWRSTRRCSSGRRRAASPRCGSTSGASRRFRSATSSATTTATSTRPAASVRSSVGKAAAGRSCTTAS